MKNKILFGVFFISLNIAAAYGQEVKDKKSKSGEKKPTVVKTVAAPVWSPEMNIFKFSDSLPKNYDGVSAEAMVKWILKKAPREKGEFEKQADFEQKISEVDEILKDKLYAFNIKDGMIYEKYDADKEAFLPRSYQSILFIGSTQKEFSVNKNHQSLGSYVGSNAYGKSVTVNKFSIDDYGVFLSKTDLIKTDLFKDEKYSFEFKNNLNVPIEKAKAIKASDISILVVGYVGVRGIKHTAVCVEPKIDSPSDGCMSGDYLPLALKKLYVYHKPTGEVLAIKDVE